MRFGAVKTNLPPPRTNGGAPTDKMNSTNTAPIWKNVTSSDDKKSMRLFPNDGVTWAEMDEWLEKTYGKDGKDTHWKWRGFGEVGKPGFQVVLLRQGCDDGDCECHEEDSDEEEEEEGSHCGECGTSTQGRKIRGLWNNTLCEECGEE